jgi:hypothetical protein
MQRPVSAATDRFGLFVMLSLFKNSTDFCMAKEL